MIGLNGRMKSESRKDKTAAIIIHAPEEMASGHGQGCVPRVCDVRPKSVMAAAEYVRVHVLVQQSSAKLCDALPPWCGSFSFLTMDSTTSATRRFSLIFICQAIRVRGLSRLCLSVPAPRRSQFLLLTFAVSLPTVCCWTRVDGG